MSKHNNWIPTCLVDNELRIDKKCEKLDDDLVDLSQKRGFLIPRSKTESGTEREEQSKTAQSLLQLVRISEE
jgi:hypothetical protein